MRSPDTKVDQDIWADPKRLRAWTIEQLYATDLDEVPWIFAVDRPERHSPHQQYRVSRETHEQLRDGLLRCKRSDPEMFERIIARSPALARYVHEKRGRPKGHAPGLAEAWDEVKRIRRLWQRAFGRSYRKGKSVSLAIEIAAARHSFDPSELVNYRKNR